jgi:drug/metabolite transporter (DMT)-like permease
MPETSEMAVTAASAIATGGPWPERITGLAKEESHGLLFALAGYAALSMGDAVVKTMAGDWPPTAIAATRYALGASGLTALLLAREGPSALRPPHAAIQLVRGLAVALATCGFFSAVIVMPLADATAITFTSPILTALLAAPLLGEPARRETWIATAVAFLGVMVVLRPNFAAIGWPALLPLASALGMSLLVLANRAVAGAASAMAMQAYLALAATPLLLAFTLAGHATGAEVLHVGWPEWSVLARCALVAVTASCAHWLIFLGTTRAGAASIAPMTYVQLLVAGTLGWAVFGERPDSIALAGAAVIVAAGVYLWRAGRMRETASGR